jgi:protein-S-isoprenylcysteine O-methyltransferase Ste14
MVADLGAERKQPAGCSEGDRNFPIPEVFERGITIPKPIVQSESSAADACQSRPKTNLGLRLITRFSLMLLVILAILFLPAGTFRFWQGWATLAAYFVPTSLGFLYLCLHDPEVVERRLESGEKVKEQKLLIRLMRPLFLVAFLLPGFDYRWGWSRGMLGAVPLWLELLSLAMVVAGFLGVSWVLRTNSYAARTIRVEAGQTVISTGPYRWVRHPMYSGSLVLFLFTPLALGSWVAWPVFALLTPFYVFRLLNEEKVLRAELPGYSEYCLRTRFRLVPYVW